MKKFAGALLLSAAISTPALAGDVGTFYGGIDMGTWAMSNTGFPNPGMFRVTGGYRFAPNLSGELGIAGAGESVICDGAGCLIYNQGALTLAAVGTFPVNNQFDLFGKVGVSSISGKLTGTGWYAGTYAKESTGNLMFGFGGQFNFNKKVGLRLQYESLGKSKSDPAATGVDVTVTSLGVYYNF